jgi:hypothetical protein
MVQYIDKSTLVAEIEKIIANVTDDCNKSKRPQFTLYGKINALENLLSFINTLEVKEVDLENAVKGRIDYPLIGVDFPNIYPNYKELKDYCDKNGIKDEDEVKIIIAKTL